jgi:hypothetical protein
MEAMPPRPPVQSTARNQIAEPPAEGGDDPADRPGKFQTLADACEVLERRTSPPRSRLGDQAVIAMTTPGKPKL